MRIGLEEVRVLVSNFMTEYHARYGGNGVMIYWQYDLKAAQCSQPSPPSRRGGSRAGAAPQEQQPRKVPTCFSSVAHFARIHLDLLAIGWICWLSGSS